MTHHTGPDEPNDLEGSDRLRRPGCVPLERPPEASADLESVGGRLATEEPATVATRWIVITGPPSSGKTTLLNLFAEAGEKTSADSTRQLIADVVASGRDAEEFRFADDFQPRVLEAMAAAEDRLDPAERVFLEYALPCNIAFHRTEGRDLVPGLAEAARRSRYAAVFILDPVGWENDEQRVEDAEYQAAVHQHMFDVYREHGYEPIRLPPISPEARYEMVRAAID